MKIFKLGDFSFLNPKDDIVSIKQVDEYKTRIKLVTNSIFVANENIKTIIRNLSACDVNLIEVQPKHESGNLFINVKNIIYIADIEGHTNLEIKGGNERISCRDSLESIMYKLQYIH